MRGLMSMPLRVEGIDGQAEGEARLVPGLGGEIEGVWHLCKCMTCVGHVGVRFHSSENVRSSRECLWACELRKMVLESMVRP